MSEDTTFAPPPADGPRGRFGVGRWIVAGVVGLFLVAGAGIGIKLFALRGTSDVLVQMVPADADVYVTAYLDPALSQKLSLRTLAGKFPALKGDQGLDRRLDQLLGKAFEDSGLDFVRDVKPWLGTQLGALVRVDAGGPHPALLVASKDDAGAKAALAKVRTASPGSWTDTQHDGVSIASGQDRQGSPTAYAYIDHTVVISDAADTVAQVIDADRGTTPAIGSSSEYTKALEGLPQDRLAVGFVNSGRLLDRFLGTLAGSGLNLPGGPLAALKANRSVGITLSAEDAGLAMQLVVSVDSSKLPAEQRSALAGSSHRNAVISWTPDDALAILALTGFDRGLKSLIDGVGGSDPELGQTLQELGVTGPDGLVAHLTGDVGLAATAGPAGDVPNLALLMATDDSAASSRFLSNVRDLASQTAGALTGSAPSWQVETHDSADYGAVEISYIGLPLLPGLEPAYAAVKDMTIIGSSREAVRAALDARDGGGNIGASPDFMLAMGGSQDTAGAFDYFDVQGIAQAVAASLSPDDRAAYERDIEPNLRPVKAFAVSGVSTPDRATGRVFILIR